MTYKKLQILLNLAAEQDVIVETVSDLAKFASTIKV